MSNLIYLDKLKEKFKLTDEFIDKIIELFNNLINFGYIPRSSVKRLSKRLYDNINTIILGKENDIDYKSGYYDSIKKELYIKNINNTESVYLRILYAITTINYDKDKTSVGYSKVYASSPDYKIFHENYGINRAVLSNLVCRILYTLPESISLMPTYRTYQNNFLGYNIYSDNDMYFLEGKLLAQICEILNINEEDLYFYIFSQNPPKYLEKILSKTNFQDMSSLLKNLDDLSRIYSNYNKLCYFENLLNENYIDIKKHILNDNIDDLEKENKRIKSIINDSLSKLKISNISEDDDGFAESIETSLSEKINQLEENIINSISYIQNLLVDNIISKRNKFVNIEYAVKLKKLENSLIIENDKLSKEIFDVIYKDLLVGDEPSSVNLIEKIKYSLINEILSNDKFKKARKSLYFRNIHDVLDDNNSDKSYITVNIDSSFIELIEINDLTNPIENLKNNTKVIEINNLKHLLNSDMLNTITSEIEIIASSIRKEYQKFSHVPLEDMFICGIDGFRLLIILQNNDINIVKLENKEGKLTTRLLTLSDSFKVFDNSSVSNYRKTLPTVYKGKKKGILKRFFSIF